MTRDGNVVQFQGKVSARSQASDRPAPFGPGFHGMVPSRNDLVQCGLPPGFLEPWQAWARIAVRRSQAQLGESWPLLFASSPVWHFALDAGLCGPEPVVGLMVAGVDRTNRQHPFVLATALPSGLDIAQVPQRVSRWLHRAWGLALMALGAPFDMDVMTMALQQLGRPPVLAAIEDAGGRLPLAVPTGWRVAIGTDGDWFAPAKDLAWSRPARSSLWWTFGGGSVAASVLVCNGMPWLDGFAAMLDGHWDGWGWHDLG